MRLNKKFLAHEDGQGVIEILKTAFLNPEKEAYSVEEFTFLVKEMVGGLGSQIDSAVEKRNRQLFESELAKMLNPEIDLMDFLFSPDPTDFRGIVLRKIAVGHIIAQLYEKLPRLHGVVIFGDSTDFLDSVEKHDLEFISTRPTAIPSVELLGRIHLLKSEYLGNQLFKVGNFLYDWENEVVEKIRETREDDEVRKADMIVGALGAP